MAGYANRTVTLDFPELSEDGDLIRVVIRNPKLVPPAEMRRKDVELDADGNPVDPDAAFQATCDVMAKLIIGWHAYDATVVDENQPLLGLPATGAAVAKLPLEILNRIGEELGKANPQVPTASPEESTSKTS
jgi:hypothetical protein